MESLSLASGADMPIIGFGTWKVPKERAADIVYEAIQKGYRHFDCACDYGNEKEVGQGMKRAMEEGLVRREDLFITSKLWNTYHRKEHVRLAAERSLADLQLAYLDLYLIHFPISLKFVPFETRYPPEWSHDPTTSPKMEFDAVPIIETWTAMESLVDAGLCRAIGISNFNTSLTRDLLASCRIRPAVNQVELHPYLTQEKLVRYCQSEGMVVTAFSPLGAGSYVELGMASEQDFTLTEPRIAAIAKRHGKTAAQVILRWGLQRRTVLIPKTTHSGRMIENQSIFDFALSQEEMTSISELNKNRRFNDPGVFCERAFQTFCPIHE